MTTKFEQDLKNGQEYEKKALSHIQQKYPKAYIVDGYCLDWDIYIPELKIGVEVKSDAQYKVTGNFYVEYFLHLSFNSFVVRIYNLSKYT